MKKPPTPKRLTKLEELTLATAQNHSHLHSAAVRASRDLMQFEIDQVEQRIVALQAAVANTKERQKTLQAQIVGLGLVLAKR